MAAPKATAPMYFSILVVMILSPYPAASESLAEPQQVPSPRVLLIGAPSLTDTHKTILSTMEKACAELTQKTSDTERIELQFDGEYIYDAIVFLDPSASLAAALPVRSIKSFLAAGNTIFVAASLDSSSYTTSLAAAIGVDISRKPLVDHISVHSGLDDGSHTYIFAHTDERSERLLGSAAFPPGNIVFHGPGATLLKDNELVRPILWGAPSAYSPNNEFGAPRVAGSAAIMTAAISIRGGGRALYFGSLSALSDETIAGAGERHKIAVSNLLRWTLRGGGLLRVSGITHWNLGPVKSTDAAYRVGDSIGVSLDIFEWEAERNLWIPFRANDLQLEVNMLDPYLRTRLKDLGNGTFLTTVTAPNQIGVYKFVVQYDRPGLSPIRVMDIVPIRPLLHNEYERFIPMAAPYYIASFSMIVSSYLLGLVLLFSSETTLPPTIKKEA